MRHLPMRAAGSPDFTGYPGSPDLTRFRSHQF